MTISRGKVLIICMPTVMMLWLVSIYTPLDHGGSQLGMLPVRSRNFTNPLCHDHVELCFLRQILERTSGEKLSKDIYDMTPLYRFKTYQWRKEGKRMKDYGALLLRDRDLNLNLPKNTDINNRTCEYDPYQEYTYFFNAYYHNGSVLVYVTEIPHDKTKSDIKRKINDIFGSVETILTKRSCKLREFFSHNGTYHIVCPILESEFVIKIQASYISVTSMEVHCAKNFIWNLKTYKPIDFSSVNIGFIGIQKPGKSIAGDCKDSKGHNSGFWFKIPPFFYWTQKSCHYSYKIGPSKLACLKTKNTIMFGDSHMQNRRDAIHSAYGLDNFQYYYTLHSFDLVTNLLDVYEKTLNGTISPNVLVMNSGAHDLLDFTLMKYIDTFGEVFIVIKKFTTLRKPPKIIWIETTPTTYNGFHGRYMTNLIVRGVNDWVDHQMEELGSEILYSHDIASPMLSEHMGYGMHFSHQLGRNVKKGQKVNVGGATTSILLNMICPET